MTAEVAAATAAGAPLLAKKWAGCEDCPHGQYGMLGGRCDQCPRGLYQTQTGQTKCVGCPHGKFPRPGTNPPTPSPTMAPTPADNSYAAAHKGQLPVVKQDDDDDASIGNNRRLTGTDWTAAADVASTRRRLVFEDDDAVVEDTPKRSDRSGETSSTPHTPAMDPCESCIAGKYLRLEQVQIQAAGKMAFRNVTVGGSCITCMVGKYASSGITSAMACIQCKCGQYAPIPGASSCTNCDQGTYVGEKGAIKCRPCGTNGYTPSDSTEGACYCMECNDPAHKR
jgi:hypothetical protein